MTPLTTSPITTTMSQEEEAGEGQQPQQQRTDRAKRTRLPVIDHAAAVSQQGERNDTNEDNNGDDENDCKMPVANRTMVEDGDSSAAVNGNDNGNGNDDATTTHLRSSSRRPAVERWVLPAGAEEIILLIAAEEILHQMLDHKLGQAAASSSSSHGGGLEVTALEELVTRFPATCLRTYEFQWEDGQTRQLYPFAMLCCLRPPLSLVKLFYQAHPPAISTQESKRGSLPLHYSCAFEASLEVVQFLYEQYPAGASTPRNDQVYPLHLACGYYSGKPDVIHFLLDQYPEGASRRCTDLYWFPLHSAAQGGAPVCVTERLYQLYPEGVTGLDKYGKTPLHTACRSKGHKDNVAFLLRVGRQALQMEDYGHFKPIFLAAMYQTPEVIQLLLQHTPERVDNLGATLLHWAAVRNSSDVVDFLATQFPDMLKARTRDRDQYTPLLGACLNEGSLESIRVLLKHDPRTLFLADGDGRLPLQAAIHANAKPAIIAVLTQAAEEQQLQQQQQQQTNNNKKAPQAQSSQQRQRQPSSSTSKRRGENDQAVPDTMILD